MQPGGPQSDNSSVLEFVRSRDPLLLEAADDVDPTLLAWSLKRSVLERLNDASKLALQLTELLRATSSQR